MTDRFSPLGRVANDSGRDLDSTLTDAWDRAATRAATRWTARMAELSKIALVGPWSSRSDIPGQLTSPPGLPVIRGSEPPLVQSDSSINVAAAELFGARRELTVQRAASLSEAALEIIASGFADHLADSISELLTDALDVAAFGAASTSLDAALTAHAAMLSAAGGLRPRAGALAASDNLRAVAAAARWDLVLPTVHLRPMPASRQFFVVPAPETGAVILPVLGNPVLSIAPFSDARPGWGVTAAVLAAPPVIAPASVVKGILA
jgi:hypothetical protein